MEVRVFKPIKRQSSNICRKRKVAAYARVSTDQDYQETSFREQVNFYTKYIKGNADWVYAGMYTDKGISGLQKNNRTGFNRMINDATHGKIDLILTKSVSRFARNTLDSISTIRKLRDNNVVVYFEKENIWTDDSKCELLLTIMSSLAQEESRSISTNVQWGYQKKFKCGEGVISYKNTLGFDKDDDGNYIIINEEAKIIRKIFDLYIKSYSYKEISDYLKNNKINSPKGNTDWSKATIRSIISNEKYCGDALLQKTFTPDYIKKKCVINNGEVPQYYITDHHKGIVSKETFALTYRERERREMSYGGSLNIYTGRVKSGYTSKNIARTIWRSTNSFKRYVFRENDLIVFEEELKVKFIEAVNLLLKNKKNFKNNKSLLDDTSLLGKTIMKKHVKFYQMESFINAVSSLKDVTDFDDNTFILLINYVKLYEDKLVFCFNNGKEILIDR